MIEIMLVAAAEAPIVTEASAQPLPPWAGLLLALAGTIVPAVVGWLRFREEARMKGLEQTNAALVEARKTDAQRIAQLEVEHRNCHAQQAALEIEVGKLREVYKLVDVLTGGKGG